MVISRYHRIGGYDWIAIPLLPYLYAVDEPEQVPLSVNAEDVSALRDAWRRKDLQGNWLPDGEGGTTPSGDWTQLVGAAYDRTLYAFVTPTSEVQDDKLIQELNAAPNNNRFSLLSQNCADFARQTG